jgi:hypothetical protein
MVRTDPPIVVLILLRVLAGTAAAEPELTASLLDHGKWTPTAVRIVDRVNGFRPAASVELTQYGGWRARQAGATGFFRTDKIDGRWWLVDPEGSLFLSAGLCSVNRAGVNRDLSVADKRFGSAEGWAAETAKLLKARRFNSLGCWSDSEPFQKAGQSMPYFPRWNFMSAYRNQRDPKLGPKGYPNECMPLFDDAFEAFCDRHARQLEATRNDPWLVGHFSDNELPFRPDLLELYLKLPETDSGHQAAGKWLAGYRQEKAQVGDAKVTPDEQEGFLEYAAHRYYSIVNAAIKRHDPNHLYVGSRIHGRCIAEPVFRGARDVDVVSINYYHRWSVEPQRMDGWVEASGRPFLISEWYAQALGNGQVEATGAGFRVKSQRDRGLFYQNLALGLLEHPACVGWHWFKYGGDGPGYAKGIVDTAYNPHTEFLGLIQQLNEQLYPLAAFLAARSKP